MMGRSVTPRGHPQINVVTPVTAMGANKQTLHTPKNQPPMDMHTNFVSQEKVGEGAGIKSPRSVTNNSAFKPVPRKVSSIKSGTEGPVVDVTK